MAYPERCRHADCSECQREQEALRRITARAVTIIKDEIILHLASPDELEAGRFNGLVERVMQMVTDAVDRASTGYADDLDAEGYATGEP